MNGNKWFLKMIIAIVVLYLAIGGLITALVFQGIHAVQDNGRWEEQDDWDRNDDDFNFDFAPMAPAVDEVPAVETVPEEVPAFMEMGDFKVALITADVGDNSIHMADAFAATCEAAGVPYDFYLNESETPEEQFELAMMLMESGDVQALAIAPLDPDMAMELNAIAAEMGVVLVTIDMGMDIPPAQNALMHINSWGSEDDIAMLLLLTMASETENAGKFGVVSANDLDPIRDAMEGYMGDFDELKNTVWKATGTGEGTEQSIEESVLYMLDRNDLDVIITTDPMATWVTARTITEGGFDVKVIGFGYPADVEPYLTDGMVFTPDHVSAGCLAANSLIGITSGNLTPKEGEMVDGGGGWRYDILMADEGVFMVFTSPIISSPNNALG